MILTTSGTSRAKATPHSQGKREGNQEAEQTEVALAEDVPPGSFAHHSGNVFGGLRATSSSGADPPVHVSGNAGSRQVGPEASTRPTSAPCKLG